MRYRNSRTRFSRALTLVEMLIAMAIMGIVFAAILPQFRAIQNSWASKQAAAETLQNSRVLMEHLYRNFSKAAKIIAVSDSSETDGYIEFEDNDASILRYDIAANNYVEFGPVGDLYELAGPVSQLQFTCYDGNDFDTAITDVNDIRFINVQTTLTNPAALGRDKTFTAQIYLRANANSGSDSGLVGWWKLDETSGLTAADSSANGNDGTLTNMAGTEWTTGMVDGALEFDGDDDFISIGTIDPDSITVSAWVTTETPTTKADIVNNQQDVWSLRNYHSPTFSGPTFTVLSGSYAAAYDTTTLTQGVSYHIVGTYDGENVRIYVNGEEGDNSPNTALSGDLDTVTGDVYIGVHADGASNPYNGIIDDVRIYNRALSAEEIARIPGVTYRQFTEAKAGSDTTSITISTPADTNEGDLLIAAVATDGDTDLSLSPPLGKGWTQINLNDYGSEVTLGAWWKNADAAESPSHQFTWSGDRQAYGWMMRFTGHDTTDPINGSMADGENSSNPTSPSVTTTVDDCIILRLGGFDDGDITVDAPGLSGHTPITMDSSAGGAGGVTYEEFTEKKEAAGGTSLTIDTPAGTSEDDLLIAAVVTEADTSGSLAPPGGEGWTEIDIGQRDGKVTLGVWWKLAAASESSTHQFTWGASKQAYGWIMRFTGHHTTSTIDDTAATGGNSGTPESPSVTTTVANAMILRIGGFKDNKITVDDPGLSGHTAITMDMSKDGKGGKCSGGAGYKIQSAIGSSGTSNFSLKKSKEYRTVTIAIAPDPAGGGGGDGVSGGAGYIKQLAIGGSGTSDFALTASEESRTLTIAIAPEASGIEMIRP